MIRTVVGLDLSKTSTGFAVGQGDEGDGAMRIVRVGTVKPHPAARGTRWHFPVVASQIERVEREIAGEAWFAARQFSLAIEANVFGESFSEFQYYLGQEALRWAERLGVDACTYAPNTLKAWVRSWSKETLPKKLGKVEIERVWRMELRPRCPDAFPSSILETDDAVDAGWLTHLGLYAQAHILPAGSFQPDQEAVPFWHDPEGFRRAFMQRRLNRFANVEAPDLSDRYGNLRDSKHLSLQGKGFYPFRQLRVLADHLRAEHRRDPSGVLSWLLARKPDTLSAKAIREALAARTYTVTADRAGKLLLVP